MLPGAKRASGGRLPAESTSFVGRRQLLAEVKAAFANTRLLTLVGPGGVGKTRLALRAGADLRRTVHDGVWFIDLAGLKDPHLVPKAVITSLGLADKSGQWPTSLLVPTSPLAKHSLSSTTASTHSTPSPSWRMWS